METVPVATKGSLCLHLSCLITPQSCRKTLIQGCPLEKFLSNLLTKK
uniref:Uncharacterized protein MANES_03G174900 n=1 Tax=Rhizophora mucronata TaxID=61149 RepID=A0A2P2J0P1_RHIMU